MKSIGTLGIPLIELDTMGVIHRFQTRSFSTYMEYLRGTDYGRAILIRLSADPRVTALNGQMLTCGGQAQSFDVIFLALWLIWCINAHGEQFANDQLNAWLDSEDIEILNSLWVLGLEVDDPITLADGYEIRRISDMPDSDEKEHFGMIHANVFASNTLPKSAITNKIKMKKALPAASFIPPSIDQELERSSREMHELALLLNSVNEAICVPYMQTAYRSETTPIGYFGGSGGGFPIFDVSTAKASKISAKSADFINQIFYHFRQKNEQEKSRLLLILNRLSQAKRRNQIEDIVLDLGILLEMLLLTDNEKDQLSLQFRLRGSWLLGKSFADRQEKSDTLKNIYNARSAVAHTGVLFRNKPSKLATLHAQLPNFFKLAEEILEKIVINGTPDWQNLILGSSTK